MENFDVIFYKVFLHESTKKQSVLSVCQQINNLTNSHQINKSTNQPLRKKCIFANLNK